MSPQFAWLSACKVALVTFVWFFSTVYFQMIPLTVCPGGCIVTLVAFVQSAQYTHIQYERKRWSQMDECPTPQVPATKVEGVFAPLAFQPRGHHWSANKELASFSQLGVNASNFPVEFSCSRDQTTKIAGSVLHRRKLFGLLTCWRSWEDFVTGRAAVFLLSRWKQISWEGATEYMVFGEQVELLMAVPL